MSNETRPVGNRTRPAMLLYVRTVTVVSVATLVLYAVVGLPRVRDFERQREEAVMTLAGPGLALAAERIARAHDRGAELAALQRSFPTPLRLVGVERLPATASDAGVYGEYPHLFVYRRVDAGTVLVAANIVQFRWSPLFFVVVLTWPLVLGGVVALMVILPATRRLHTLGSAIRQFAAGDLRARSTVRGADVIGELSSHFDKMAAQIQQLVEGKRQLLEAVSHEFRTPVARIRFELEMLAGAASDPERAQRAGNIDDNLVELDELVEEVVTYTRFDSGNPALPYERLSPATVALGVIRATEVLRDDVHIERVGMDHVVSPERSHEVSRDLSLEANARYFRRALQNMVINAIRYATHRVRVTIRAEEEHVLVIVEDDGPGVAAADRQRIFEPFSRLETSRNRDVGGMGLGLAIVQRICVWHDASIEVGVSELGGAAFVSKWPRERREPVHSRPRRGGGPFGARSARR